MGSPSGVQLVNRQTMDSGYANPFFVRSFPQVRQPDCRQEQVRSSVKENESERVIVENPSCKRSTCLPFQRISGQCSLQHSSWNNLQWVDEVEAKVAEGNWENVESSELATTGVNAETTRDSEVLEMDV